MQPEHDIWIAAEIAGTSVRCRRIVSIGDDRWLCRDESGRWLVLEGTIAIEVAESKPIAVLQILERSPSEAASEINRANGHEADSRALIAPVRWALTTALNGPMDYWAALALKWIEWYGNASDLATPLETVSRSRWASQSTRHRAKRLASSR
jgi:hypothetical protein